MQRMENFAENLCDRYQELGDLPADMIALELDDASAMAALQSYDFSKSRIVIFDKRSACIWPIW